MLALSGRESESGVTLTARGNLWNRRFGGVTERGSKSEVSPSFVLLFGIESAEQGKTNVPTWYVLDILEGKV